MVHATYLHVKVTEALELYKASPHCRLTAGREAKRGDAEAARLAKAEAKAEAKVKSIHFCMHMHMCMHTCYSNVDVHLHAHVHAYTCTCYAT